MSMFITGRAATRIIFVVTKLLSQHMFITTTKICLSWQNVCRNKIMFVVTKYFCCDKAFFCHDKDMFCHNKDTCLSQQRYLFVTTNIGHEITFVTTNIILSWQDVFCHDKHISVATQNFCHDKKMRLVAAPTNDTCLDNTSRKPE